MHASRRAFLKGSAAAVATGFVAFPAFATDEAFAITTPMAPPPWALLERELLKANTEAIVQFFDRYYDKNTGWLEETTRWGGDDGPDDAIENANDWPHVYALGGGAIVKTLVEKAYEGHVRQYTAAKTTEVPFARDGMYYKEFPVMMDWQHNGEGLSVFNLLGLVDPYNPRYRGRVRRFAGFYDGSDPGAPNWDAKHKLIPSMFNGSRGPLMRQATALDWTGDSINIQNRFPSLLHGEHTYAQMLEHFKDYTETLGDTPLNLGTLELALNAYMLAHEEHYKDWALGYADAWIDRAKQNHDILPSNVGRDGVIGSDAGGKWYGGTYGWAFSPIVPMTGKRQDRNRMIYASVAFFTAYLLSNGDDKYLDVWRRQTDRINAAAKMVNGKMSSPWMYGDQGWYSFKPGKWQVASLEIYYFSMKASDRARAPANPWFDFLDGKNPGYPEKMLQADLARISRLAAVTRADTTSPDMRLADSALDNEPASVQALIHCMEGGISMARPRWAPSSPDIGGAPLHCRLRYFDPEHRRPGIPEDVAALVEAMDADSVTVTLINISPSAPRNVLVQGGAYGEHQIVSVSDGTTTKRVDAAWFPVRLAPASGARLVIRQKRFANAPTLDLPWVSTVADLGDPPVLGKKVDFSD